MDYETRAYLIWLGWTPSKGRDSAGNEYEAWYKLGAPKPAYFFVYNERMPTGDVVRPKTAPRPKKKS